MEDVQSLVQECAILKDISDHPNIVKLHEVYHVAGGNKLNMVMDVVRGGTLFDAIVDSPAEHLTERFTARIMAGCCSALAFMHKKGIAHRDIKPENIMLLPKADRDRGDFVELCDFGFARLFDEAAGMMMSTCGTPEYVAPEVLKHTGYSASCDVWSMGVVLYVMLSGYTPFYSDNTSKLFKQIMNGKLQMPACEWGTIALQCARHVQRRHGLAARVLAVGHSIADHVRHVALEHVARLVVDDRGEALHTAPMCISADGSAGQVYVGPCGGERVDEGDHVSCFREE